MDNNILIKSEDGSHTIRSETFGVTYHSIYGAIDESITVFLSAGFQYQILQGKKEVSVFEMGFGTGLNAYLTLIECTKQQIPVTYNAIEKYPLTQELVKKLNYPTILGKPENRETFIKIHEQNDDETSQVTEYFSLRKIIGDLEDHQSSKQYDVIYYDAFAPAAQPELWTEEAMQKMYDLTAKGGILVTYCAKGSFKRALRSAGFSVEAIPGPPGKREMTRAHKPY